MPVAADDGHVIAPQFVGRDLALRGKAHGEREDEGPQGPQGSSGITREIQTLRVPYTPSPADQNNYYANVPITFSTAFADTNYSISVSVELEASQYPLWAANTALTLGYTVIDPNGMIQQVTTAGTTGATEPTWSTGPAYNGTTTDGTVTWTVYTIGDFFFYNGAKSKTASGFIAECGTYDAVNPDTTPFILSVTAVHD